MITEIINDIDSGEAHLMTRNELAEFIRGYTTREDADELAKAWFVEKGYEKA